LISKTAAIVHPSGELALDKSEGSVKGVVVLGGAMSTAGSPERLRSKTLEISR
jgi:hypothetical protein